LRGLVCELHALPARDWNFGAAPTVLVSLRRVDGGHADLTLLQQALDLSPAEAEIAMLVAQGLSRDEIARRRWVSSETIATQIKAIFRKSDLRRQTQLAALVARLEG
jgi:DNA-binding CsgD family transcriptional regulator